MLKAHAMNKSKTTPDRDAGAHKASAAILYSERSTREAKTAKLRALRLAKEAAQEAPKPRGTRWSKT